MMRYAVATLLAFASLGHANEAMLAPKVVSPTVLRYEVEAKTFGLPEVPEELHLYFMGLQPTKVEVTGKAKKVHLFRRLEYYDLKNLYNQSVVITATFSDDAKVCPCWATMPVKAVGKVWARERRANDRLFAEMMEIPNVRGASRGVPAYDVYLPPGFLATKEAAATLERITEVSNRNQIAVQAVELQAEGVFP